MKKRTEEATKFLTERSLENERILEEQLNVDSFVTTPLLCAVLGWSTGKMNATIYRLKKKGKIRYDYWIVDGRTEKRIWKEEGDKKK